MRPEIRTGISAQGTAFVPLERGGTRESAAAFGIREAHLGKEGGSLRRNHAELPFVPARYVLLHFDRIRARDDHRRKLLEVRQDAVDPVRPHSAVIALRTHVEDDDEIFLILEAVRQ